MTNERILNLLRTGRQLLDLRTALKVLNHSLWLTVAALLSALAVVLFLVPSGIAPGGLSGIAIIANAIINTPVGITMLLLNVPILILGYFMLGGWRVITKSIYFVVLFSVFTDVLTPLMPSAGLTDNHLLSAIFSGILMGIGGGVTFRLGATGGGTAILIRVLNIKLGMPSSSATLYIDGVIVAVSGLVFGWEAAMYAIISLVVYGAMVDYVLEGPSVIRTATIVTDRPQEVSNALMRQLNRGVTGWEARGMFTEQAHTVLFITVLRPQVEALRYIVSEVDPHAFIVIGHGHTAYGSGFRRMGPPKR